MMPLWLPLTALAALFLGSAKAASSSPATPAPAPAGPFTPTGGFVPVVPGTVPATVPGTAPGTGTGGGSTAPAGKGAGQDLIISIYALTSLDWWPNEGPRPILRSWEGEPTGGHPRWDNYGNQLRDADGALLPNLLARWQLDNVRRIAVVGFSAGSNSGLQAFLKSPKDRARLDFIGSIDGVHANVANPDQVDPARPLSHFIQYSMVDGLYSSMLRAAGIRTQGMVMTASSVAAPAASAGSAPPAQTKQALGWLVEAVARQLNRWSGGSITPDTDDLLIPATLLDALKPYKLNRIITVGDLVVAWFDGDQKADHINQAGPVSIAMLKTYLAPRWGKTPGTQV